MKRRKNDAFYKLFMSVFIIYIFIYLIKYLLNNVWLLSLPIIAITLYLYINQKKKEELINCYQTIESLFERYKNNPTDFEHYVADLYHLMGYKTKVTSKTNDGGKDIIMWKDGKKSVVEVKLYAKTNLVDRPKIQKLHSAMIDSEADDAIFVTTSNFTEPAIRYANKFNIRMVNGIELTKLIYTINNK